MTTNSHQTTHTNSTDAAKLNGVSKTVPKPRPTKEATLRELRLMIKEHSILGKWGHPAFYVNANYPYIYIADIKISLDPFNAEHTPRFQLTIGEINLHWLSLTAEEVLKWIDNIAAFNEQYKVGGIGDSKFGDL